MGCMRGKIIRTLAKQVLDSFLGDAEDIDQVILNYLHICNATTQWIFIAVNADEYSPNLMTVRFTAMCRL